MDFSTGQPAAEAFHLWRVERGNDPSSEDWRARGRRRGLETRREKGLCLFRAKKSLKRRGTVGSAAANPHNGRIVRNGSTNLRVIYVLITGLQRGRARFAHVPLPLLSASHNGNNGGKTDTRACYRSETLLRRERERARVFSAIVPVFLPLLPFFALFA